LTRFTPPPAERDPGDALLAAHDPPRVPGVIGEARSFDGLSHYLEASRPDAIGTGDLSVTAWVRTIDAPDVAVIVDQREEGTSVRGYALYLYRGRLSFQLADGTGSGHRCSVGPEDPCTNYFSERFVADGAWHATAVTVRRRDRDGGVFYVDG